MSTKILTLLAFFCSGAAALIYQVAWLRPIGMVFGSSIYSISIVLFSFMIGLAVGSLIAARYIERIKNSVKGYVLIEAGIAISGLAMIALFAYLPVVQEHVLTITTPFAYMSTQFIALFFILLIPTALMGATFPILAKLYITKGVGEGIGELYFANNLGAIVGSLAAGFALIPTLGVTQSIYIAVALNFLAAVCIAIAYKQSQLTGYLIVAALAVVVISPCAVYSPAHLYLGGSCRLFNTDFLENRTIESYAEGRYGSVVIFSEGENGVIKRLLVNNQGSSSLRFADMRVSLLSAALPYLFNPQAQSAFVIGYGTGSASAFLSQEMRTITAEIEPEVLEASHYFEAFNSGLTNNPNHTIVLNDARSQLLTDTKKYDIIVNHPLDPFQSASSLLFTEEFLTLAESRLNDGGVYSQWLPLYNLSKDDFLNFLHTIGGVFDHYLIFITVRQDEQVRYVIPLSDGGEFIDEFIAERDAAEMIIVASDRELNPMEVLQSFAQIDSENVSLLKNVSLDSPERILRLLTTNKQRISANFTEEHKAITDDYPSIEFSAPLIMIKQKLFPAEELMW